MEGIDLNSQIIYKGASLRFFGKGEKHISRVCNYDVLLLVFEGVLRFWEDGKEYEIGPGRYHIQKRGSVQKGNFESDSPKYLYIHFLGDWVSCGEFLPKCGEFNYNNFSKLIAEMDSLSHRDAAYTALTAKFFEILVKLYRPLTEKTLGANIARYIEDNLQSEITLEVLSEQFHFCKNHIINSFKKEFNMPPIAYINNARIKQAEYLMAVTSRSIESICLTCGFKNYSHFYKEFVKKNSISPKVWREKARLGY